jgi:hypothetical protein
MRRGERDFARTNLIGLNRGSFRALGDCAGRQDSALACFCAGDIPLKPKCGIAAKRIRQHETQPFASGSPSVLLTSKIGGSEARPPSYIG